MTRRNPPRPRAFDPDPEAPGRCCDIPGCEAQAGYRAPRARDALREYFWFCLAHVREYNSRWDYYKGMSPGQIEAQLRADASWDRPSWKLGHAGGGKTAFNEEDVLDPLDVLGASRRARAQKKRDAATQRTPDPLREPLSALGLNWPVSLDEVKARYKTLARKHHPDANGGDRNAEERLKVINVAYTTLRVHLTANAHSGLEKSA